MSISTFSVQVYIFDTDCYGIVWHGTYLKWLEMARWQLLLACGLGHGGSAEQAWLFPVVEQALQFKQPSTLNDTLLIETQVTPKGARLVFSQQVFKGEGKTQAKTLCLKAETTCVVTNPSHQLQRRVPPALLNALGLAL